MGIFKTLSFICRKQPFPSQNTPKVSLKQGVFDKAI